MVDLEKYSGVKVGDDVSLSDIFKREKIILKSPDPFGRLHISNLDFSGIRFFDAIFYRIDFVHCNFCDADFNYADITQCTFINCTIEKGSFQRTRFDHVIFDHNNLNGSDFADAVFYNTRSIGSTFASAVWLPPLVCPEKGSFTAFKKVYIDGIRHKEIIAKLYIPSSARRTSGFDRKCRCDKAKVVGFYDLYGNRLSNSIIARSMYNGLFEYRHGEYVYPWEGFNEDRWCGCGSGIHFFITFDEAAIY